MTNQSNSMITRWPGYEWRLIALALVLALATAAAILLAPQIGDIRIIDSNSFNRMDDRSTALRIVFSRTVDRRSAERAFVLLPPTAGRFVWIDAQTLEFQPAQPLQPETIYNITIRPGLSDTRGRINRAESRWSFRTGP